MSILGIGLILVSLLFDGLVTWILLISGLVFSFFAFSNIYLRLRTKWSRIYYAMSYRYAASAGYVVGQQPDMPKAGKITNILGIVLASLYPDLSKSGVMFRVGVVEANNVFRNQDILEKTFIHKGVEREKAREIAEKTVNQYNEKNKEDESPDVMNFYTHVIRSKYSNEVMYDFIFDYLSGRIN